MSKKQKNETSAKAPVKLTRAEKKEIQAVIRKYKGDGKPHSAQASIPYEAMYQDGVCRVTPRTFSKCIEFTDISYQLAQADTKTAIFENLCDLYNYLDASIHVQFSFINRKIDPKQYAKSFEIRAQGDDFDDIRSEYSDILQDQLVNGNNGLMKRKFMTYTIEADSLKMARARLRRIETDLLGYFKSMGASAWGLDAKERLEVMHSIFHPDGEPFSFDWKWLAPSGLSTKDFIAPSSFRFGNARMFGLGGKYGAVSFLQILSPELSDEMLADFLNTENGIVVNLHVQAIDQSDAIKTVKRKITDLDAMKIQEQKRAVRSGYDMDILPSDLATYGQDAKELLKTLQSRNERMFQLTFLVLNTADTRQKLENDVFWAAGIAQKYNCSLVRLDYQQEQGLMSEVIENRSGELVFSVSIDDFIDSYNGYYWNDKNIRYLLPSTEWRSQIYDTAIHSNYETKYYNFTEDEKIWSLPTISVYVPTNNDYIQEITLNFDDHSYTKQMYTLYEEMCFYTLRVLFPDCSSDKITELYMSLNKLAYDNVFPNEKGYNSNSTPCALYYKNGIGLYPYFAIGECVHLCIIPVTQETISDFEARGVRIYEIE